MKCIYCMTGETRVIDSAHTDITTYRTRICTSCGQSYTTEEHAAEDQASAARQLGKLRYHYSRRKQNHDIDQAKA